jgi:flagellar motor switch/type III secretory pathway protein FliN
MASVSPTSWASVLPRRDRQEVEYRTRWAPAVARLRAWGNRLARLVPEVVQAWWPVRASEALVLRFRLTDGDGTEQDLEVRKTPFRIGRGAACHLQLPDPTVSTEHAEVQVERGSVWLMDLRSTNGTKKNGQRLEPLKPEALQPGDVIEVGRYRLTYIGMELGTSEKPRLEIQGTRLQPLNRARPFQVLAHPNDRWLRVQWDGWTAWVRVPARWIRACWDFITDVPWDDTWGSDPMEEGMAQFVVFQISAGLSDRTGVAFQVSGWATPEAADALASDDDRWLYMDVWLHSPPLKVASTVLIRVEPSEPPWPAEWDDLVWPVAVYGGWIRLRVADWRRVEPGDVLLPDVWFPTSWESAAEADLGPVYVRTGRIWHTGRLRREAGSLKLTLEKLWIRTPGDDGPMADVEQPVGEPETLSPHDLELQVVIELDRFPTTLGEMKRWQVGQCLVLQRGPDDPVRLVVETGFQRRVLAEGRVVVIDGKLGIEIVRILTQFQ